MKKLIVLSTFILSCINTQFSHADQTYICLFDNSERLIKVSYTYADSKVPCEVVYEKNTGSQVLWNAQSEEGYCEARAAEFVEKQRGWGWDCALMEPTEVTTTPAQTQ
jgi:hypothetical protein